MRKQNINKKNTTITIVITIKQHKIFWMAIRKVLCYNRRSWKLAG